MKSFEHAGLGEYAVALLDELDTMFWKRFPAAGI